MAGVRAPRGPGTLDLNEMIQLMKDTTGCDWEDPDKDEAEQDLNAYASPRTLAQKPLSHGNNDSPSTALIASYHKTKEEPQPQRQYTPNYKMNKAQEIASRSPPKPRLLRNENRIWPEPSLEKGSNSLDGSQFIPWKLVKKYTELYVGRRSRELTVESFSDEGIHTCHAWDFFYLYHPRGLTKRPILFVPSAQFEHHLDVVNARFDIQLTVPEGKESRFRMTFGDGNTPRPRFLGRSTNQDTFQALCATVPDPLPGDMSLPTNPAAEDLLKRLEMVSNIDNRSSKAKKSEKNRKKRAEAHKSWGETVKRVQRYLGLRQKRTAGGNASKQPEMLDPSCPPRHVPEDSVIFVSIDIEAFEHNQDIVTEVGIAVLDTERIRSVAPGDKGAGWFGSIEAHHFRIKENVWARNKQYVRGCPEYFDFGKSQFVKLKAAAKTIEDIIVALSSPKGSTVKGGVITERPVVLVFHDPSQDIKYLNTLGLDIFKFHNVREVVDTQEMHQYINRALNPAGLNTVLAFLKLSAKHLHNAGNDAVYTLQAMISLAVKQRLASLERASGKKNRLPSALSNPTTDEGWSSGGENSDGGMPPRLGGMNAQLADAGPSSGNRESGDSALEHPTGEESNTAKAWDVSGASDSDSGFYPKNIDWGK